MIWAISLLTLDIGKAYAISAKLDVADKEGMDDAERAMQTLLYVGSHMARLLPKNEPEFRGMTSLSEPVRKAFKAAKVERKGTTLSTTVTLALEAGLAKKVRAEIGEANKNREKMYREKPKSRPIYKDTVKDSIKDTVKDTVKDSVKDS